MTDTTLNRQSERGLARGVLSEASDERIVFSVPGTEYRLHLAVYKKPSTPIGKRISGTIRAQARRIDVVHTGGRYIEPLFGRPRRVQGEVIALDPVAQSITVDAGAPIVCKVGSPQRAEQFQVGDFVSFDVSAGATFTQSLN